jgi:hypothetical protein
VKKYCASKAFGICRKKTLTEWCWTKRALLGLNGGIYFGLYRTLQQSYGLPKCPRLLVHNPAMNHSTPPRHPITCEVNRKTYKGTYWVAGKILTVATGGGGKSKQVGTMEPEALAKQLLLELVNAGKA